MKLFGTDDFYSLAVNFPNSKGRNKFLFLNNHAYDQNFYGWQGWWMGRGGNNERCLKWGGRAIKEYFQKHLKIGGG